MITFVGVSILMLLSSESTFLELFNCKWEFYKFGRNIFTIPIIEIKYQNKA